MTILKNTLDGANGAAVSTAATTGDAITLAGTAAVTAVYDTGSFAEGTSSVKLGAMTAGQTKIVSLATQEAPQQAVMEGYFRLDGLPTGTTGQVVRVGCLATPGTPVAGVDITQAGKVQISTLSGAAVGAVSSSALTVGKWYRFGVAAKIGAAGSSLVSGYVAEAYSSTTLHSASQTTTDLSTRTITGGQIGSVVASAAISGLGVDMPRFETGTTTFAGAFVSEPSVTTVNELANRLVSQTNSALAKRDTQITSAQNAASSAQTAANNAQTTANSANTAASNAQTTANNAVAKPTGLTGDLVLDGATGQWKAAPTSGGGTASTGTATFTDLMSI